MHAATLRRRLLPLTLVAAMLATTLFAVPRVALAGGTVGSGTPASCTNAAFDAALAGGGSVTFNCGPDPVTIIILEKTIAADTTIDGDGLVTLSGNNANRLFYVNPGITLTMQEIALTRGLTTSTSHPHNRG